MWETQVWSLGREDPLEKEMLTHSSILAWRIPWMEKPGGLQSMGSQRVGHDWATSFHFTSLHDRINGTVDFLLSALGLFCYHHTGARMNPFLFWYIWKPGLAFWINILWDNGQRSSIVFLELMLLTVVCFSENPAKSSSRCPQVWPWYIMLTIALPPVLFSLSSDSHSTSLGLPTR